MEKLKDIPIPSQYEYIWEHFLEIWWNCEFDINGNRVFTFSTILDYQKLFGHEFSFSNKKMLFKMKAWANEIISDLNKD